MLTFNYQYRIYPNRSQEEKLIEIMEICRGAYNYALREIKDWCNSRKYFDVVDARGSSQTCPHCGVHVKKDLSIRVHNCPECNYEADRDVAAAQVLKNRGIEQISTAGLVGKETA